MARSKWWWRVGWVAAVWGAGSVVGCGKSTSSDNDCAYDGRTVKDGASFAASDGCNTCACNDGEVNCTLVGCSAECQVGGVSYSEGASFPSDDGCNTCTCGAGEVSCTQRACQSGCVAAGMQYAVGESFAASDGCNECNCQPDGTVACTAVDCPDCQQLADAHATAVEQAERCDPNQVDACSLLVEKGLGCGCNAFFANPAEVEALANLEMLRSAHAQCTAVDAPCGACAKPERGICTVTGHCKTIYEGGCKVEGQVYALDATDIPHPESCNTCTCGAGALRDCTLKSCPEACPDGFAYGQDCLQCGDNGGCWLVELGCFRTCSETTDDCRCMNGLCLNGFICV